MFPALLRPLAVAALCAVAFLSPAHAQKAMNEADKTAIEQIVRDYLMAHPDIIIDSLNAYREQQEAAQA
jgi:hypothetical protein